MTPLALHLHSQIDRAGGWIGADAFMQTALYFPGLGYYTGGADPFGSQGAVHSPGGGDFVTAPMLGSWLAKAILGWAEPMRPVGTLGRSSPFRIREFGGGRGDLAADLLRLSASDSAQAGPPLEIEMVELSADLQRRQETATRGLGPITWQSTLSPGFSGLVLANEVLDAMPVQCFEWAGGTNVLEWGVSTSGERLVWSVRPASPPLQQIVLSRQTAASERGLPWDIGYRGEHCPWVGPWCQSLYDSMDQGALLLVDYGHAQPELDHPGRTRGTLCGHYQHRRIDGPDALLERLGAQDLTAHVDFSLVARSASAAGFSVAGFVTQARFLMNVGLLDWAQDVIQNTPDVVARTRLLQSLQMLLSESEMGEVFKVMLLTKELPSDVETALVDSGFASGDRRASL
jgi:SAM-dependent MidA family methyltransferase